MGVSVADKRVIDRKTGNTDPPRKEVKLKVERESEPCHERKG